MTVNELIDIIGIGLKKAITPSDLLGPQIEISYLKRIDKVFNKGLHFYLDPSSPEISRDASIFFRKSHFEADLNIGAKKIVNQFEEFKISLSAISKLAKYKIERKLPVYNIQQDPKMVALEVRKQLYPDFSPILKDFLKNLIGKFAEFNILVFEFMETWNKKEKANIDGFFLKPNVIVIKRQQVSFRREIFTLAHELGHYLLNEEEVEQLEIQSLASISLTRVERWCNDFAYYFLIGSYENIMQNIDKADGSNDYHFSDIEKISKATHLSKIALFTRLLYEKKISSHNYSTIKKDFEERSKQRHDEIELQRALEKQNGSAQRGSTPKPINSPLLVSTIQAAFYEGVINEYDVCKTLNIKPEKFDRFV